MAEAELETLGVARTALAPGAHYIAGGTAELLMGWVEQPKGVSAE